MAEPEIISEDEYEFDSSDLESFSEEDDLDDILAADSGDILLDTDSSDDDSDNEEDVSEVEEEIQVRGDTAFKLLKGKGDSLIDLDTAALGLFNLHELGDEDSPTPSSSRSWKDDQSVSSRSSILHSLTTNLSRKRKIKLAPNLQEFLGLEPHTTWKPWKSTLREIENADPTNEHLQFISEKVQTKERSEALLKSFLDLYSTQLAAKPIPRSSTYTLPSPIKCIENIYKKVFDLSEVFKKNKSKEEGTLDESEFECEYGIGVSEEDDLKVLDDMVDQLEKDVVIDKLKKKSHVEVTEQNYKKVMSKLNRKRLKREESMKEKGMCPHQRKREKFSAPTERNTVFSVLPNKCLQCSLQNQSIKNGKAHTNANTKKEFMNVSPQKSPVNALEKTQFKPQVYCSNKRSSVPEEKRQLLSKETPCTSQQAKEIGSIMAKVLKTSKLEPLPSVIFNPSLCGGIGEPSTDEEEKEEEEVWSATEDGEEIEEVVLSSEDERDLTVFGDKGAPRDMTVAESTPSSKDSKMETRDLSEGRTNESVWESTSCSISASHGTVDLPTSNLDENEGQSLLVTRDLPASDETEIALPNFPDFADIVAADEIPETYALLSSQLTAILESSLRIIPAGTENGNEGETRSRNSSHSLDRKTSLDEDLELSNSDSSTDSDSEKEGPRTANEGADEFEHTRTHNDELQITIQPRSTNTTLEPRLCIPAFTPNPKCEDEDDLATAADGICEMLLSTIETVELMECSSIQHDLIVPPPSPINETDNEVDTVNGICEMLLSTIEADELIEFSSSQHSLTAPSPIVTKDTIVAPSINELMSPAKPENDEPCKCTFQDAESLRSEEKRSPDMSEQGSPGSHPMCDELAFNSITIDEARRAALALDLELSDSDSSSDSESSSSDHNDSDSSNDEECTGNDSPKDRERELGNSEALVNIALNSPSSSSNSTPIHTSEAPDLNTDTPGEDDSLTKEEIALKYLKPFLNEMPFTKYTKFDEINLRNILRAKEETRPVVVEIKDRTCFKRLNDHFTSPENMQPYMNNYGVSEEKYRELLEETSPALARINMDMTCDYRGGRVCCLPKLIPRDTTNLHQKDYMSYITSQPGRTYKARQIEGGYLCHDPKPIDTDDEVPSSSAEEEEEDEEEKLTTVNQDQGTNDSLAEVLFNVSFYEPIVPFRKRSLPDTYDLNYFKCVFEFNEDDFNQRKPDLKVLLRKTEKKNEGHSEYDALKGLCTMYSKELARTKKIGKATTDRMSEGGTKIGDFILSLTEWDVRNSKSVRDQCGSEESILHFLVRLKKMRKKIVALRSGLAMDDMPEELLSVSDREEDCPDVNLKIDIISSSTLEDLCHTFKCYRGSEEKVLKTWRQLVKPGRVVDPDMEPQYIIFGSTVYCDTTNSKTVEFVQNIVQIDSQNTTREKMTVESWKVPLASLHLRLGWPYSFVHRGVCEHHVFFTKTRVSNPEELKILRRTPRVKDVRQPVEMMCQIRLPFCSKIARFSAIEIGEKKRGRTLLCFHCACYFLFTNQSRSREVTLVKTGKFSASCKVDKNFKIYRLRPQILHSKYKQFRRFWKKWMREIKQIGLPLNSGNAATTAQQVGINSSEQDMMGAGTSQNQTVGSIENDAKSRGYGRRWRPKFNKFTVARRCVLKSIDHSQKIKQWRLRREQLSLKLKLMTSMERVKAHNDYNGWGSFSSWNFPNRLLRIENSRGKFGSSWSKG